MYIYIYIFPKHEKPPFEELGQTSRQKSGIWSETEESWDVWPNSPKSGKSIDLPLFGELGQTSRDSSVSDQIPDFCWDVWPNSPKSGKSILARSKTHELVFWIFIFVAGAFFFRDWRACGLACAPRPPKVDRADRGTPRHFNIIAYGWILGDEWRFCGTDFFLLETLNQKIARSRWSVTKSTCHFSAS